MMFNYTRSGINPNICVPFPETDLLHNYAGSGVIHAARRPITERKRKELLRFTAFSHHCVTLNSDRFSKRGSRNLCPWYWHSVAKLPKKMQREALFYKKLESKFSVRKMKNFPLNKQIRRITKAYGQRLCMELIPKLAMLIFSVHYEPLNSNWL